MRTLDDLSEEEMADVERRMEFVRAAVVAIKSGKCVFTCPLCGADAVAKVSSFNGHKSGKCEACGMLFME